jgi:uncharacterized repeat protein (TIGR04076 family)
MTDDGTFELFDLKITIDEIRGTCTCGHSPGDYFELKSGQLSIPAGRSFCVYAVQSTLPLLPAKQRRLHPADWMATDTRIICPDPLCGVLMRVERTAERRVRHDDVSAVPLGSQVPSSDADPP